MSTWAPPTTTGTITGWEPDQIRAETTSGTLRSITTSIKRIESAVSSRAESTTGRVQTPLAMIWTRTRTVGGYHDPPVCLELHSHLQPDHIAEYLVWVFAVLR